MAVFCSDHIEVHSPLHIAQSALKCNVLSFMILCFSVELKWFYEILKPIHMKRSVQFRLNFRVRTDLN
jgi:hypothetical protein